MEQRAVSAVRELDRSALPDDLHGELNQYS